MIERHAPGESNPVGVHVFHAGAFVRIKAKIDQQLQNIRVIVHRGDGQHASVALNRVAQRTLRVPRPKPARVPQRHSSPRCHSRTRPYQPVRDIGEFRALVRVRVRRAIEWCLPASYFPSAALPTQTPHTAHPGSPQPAPVPAGGSCPRSSSSALPSRSSSGFVPC